MDTTSGAVADGFHGDTSNGSDQVNSLVASSGRLYAGGSFAGIGGLSRSNTASLFLDSGSADPGFRTDTDQPVKALALGDGHLFLAGGFTSVNGDATQHKLAAVDPVTGTPAAGFGSPRTDSGTQDSLATLPGKRDLGGAFTTINDSFPRNGAAAFDSGNAVPSAWDAAPGGGTVDVAALAPAGSELAIGGEFTTLAGGLRHELGAVDPDHCGARHWLQPRPRRQGPRTRGHHDRKLYAGGDFLNSAAGLQPHFAAFSSSQPGAPISATSPTITGTAQEGQTLAADPGTWTGNPTSYAYSWRSCDPNGFNCTDTGVTGSTYLLHASDIAHTLIVRVTASNGHGPSGPADSGHSAPVSASSSVNAPTASTGGTTGITASERHLDGTVNPHGQDTTYSFDYGTEYQRNGHSSPAVLGGDGNTDVAVEGQLVNLQPATTYHYRLLSLTPFRHDHRHRPAVHDDRLDRRWRHGTQSGHGSRQRDDRDHGTLGATVNPGGTETSYYFEYGADQSYGQSSQLYSAGSGMRSHAVSGELADLQPDTTYHFRVVAHNDAATARGSDATFTTSPIPAPTNTDPPQISGTPQVGQTLTALHGTWTPTPTSYAYQWRTCDGAGDNCQGHRASDCQPLPGHKQSGGQDDPRARGGHPGAGWS